MIQESWLKVLAKVGVGSAIGLYLVWLLAGTIQQRTERTEQMMQAHVHETQRLLTVLDVLVNVNLQNCINQAGTVEAKRDECFAALYRPPTPKGSR